MELGCCMLTSQHVGEPPEADCLSPFASCVNNRDVLRQNLLRSPDVAPLGVRVYENQRSAAAAYNDALAKAGSKDRYTAFVHQDVYLPRGWLATLEGSIDLLSSRDPSWGVLGCYGVTASGEHFGHVYSNGLGVLGKPFHRPVRVRTLDEIVLVVRNLPGLRFTANHPGFHMYGADICLHAEQLGLHCYAIDNYCVHNTRYDYALPLAFYQGYRAILRSFPAALPVTTPCALVSRHREWRMLISLLRQELARRRGRLRIAERLADPLSATGTLCGD